MKILINPSNRQILKNPYAENFCWIHEEVDSPALKELYYRYAKRAISVSQGRNRNTFIMPGGYVVKLPCCGLGFADNDWEGSVSNTEESIGCEYSVQYPKARMVFYEDIPVVFMEYVEHLSREKIIEQFGEEPDWVMEVDGGQVGTNKQGRLVAYDYGRY